MSLDMQAQLQQLQEQLRVEQQRTEQAQQRAEQAQQRAEQAERLTQSSTLSEYLRGYHDGPYRAFSVQRIKSMTTKGTVTNPERKICPTYLRPWTTFTERQQEAFYQLPLTEHGSSNGRAFAPLQYLEQLGRDQALRRIGSEKDLEIFERATVEIPITYIMQHLHSQPDSRQTFNLSSNIEFENHPNTLSDQAEEVIERREISQPSTPTRPSNPSIPLRADQICVYKTTDERRIPLLLVEYKAPHKLTLPHIRLGLREMNVKDEVIDRYTQPDPTDGDAAFQCNSDRLVAAVVTQLYSYMVESGLEYSYLTTGEAFIFLHVRLDEPNTAYYHLADPTAEVAEAIRLGEDYLSWTAVGQVLAFCLLAFQSQPRDQAWRRAATKDLCYWIVDDAAILHKIPETVRKQTPPPSAFVPRTYRATTRSPIVTRSKKRLRRCSGGGQNAAEESDDSSIGSGEAEHLTTPIRRGGNLRQLRPRPTGRTEREGPSQQEQGQTRAYCTQLCLLGLKNRGKLHKSCPNLALHRLKPNDRYHQLDKAGFCALLQKQLERDLDHDCEPLGIQGSRGALFKITLSDYGYTIVAKGTVSVFVPDLQHEAAIYKHLEAHQGTLVPVCLGAIDLSYPYYYDIGVRIVHMMLLGWGGDCLIGIDENKAPWADRIQRSIEAIHKEGVLHGDLRTANMLWNEGARSVVLIDFERAVLRDDSPSPATPLCPVSPNKGKRALKVQEKLLK
ncbi:hypothetical protein MMC19_007101 [Ptychographa xylographoides]|nr:hypothetical protein [Ptychographa xylographoides]